MDLIHFGHVIAFAIILGVDLPAFYAARRVAADGASVDARKLAASVVRWSNLLSTISIALLLPLGVSLGADLGVYRVNHEISLTITWIVGGVWVALVIAAETFGTSGLGARLYAIEIWVRIVIGLGNIYDGVSAIAGFGNSPIETKWLALKVLLLGLVMVLSAFIRHRLKPVRIALAETTQISALTATWDAAKSDSVAAALKSTRPLVHSIFLFVLIAAWMGINKSWP
jgi:hypothetical protein